MLAALFGQAAVSVETPLGPHLRVPDITLTVGAQVRVIDKKKTLTLTNPNCGSLICHLIFETYTLGSSHLPYISAAPIVL
jgi:hypothetical protein